MKEGSRPEYSKSDLRQSLTRRSLLEGAGKALFASQLLGISSFGFYEKTKSSQKRFDRDFFGYETISLIDLQILKNEYSESTIFHQEVEHNPETELCKVTFTLPESSQVLLSIPGGQNETVFVDPLIAQSENKRKYFVPVIHADREDRSIPTSVNLGKYSEGDHTLTIKRHGSVSIDPDFEITKLQLTTPSSTSLLSKFIEHQPIIKLKDSNNPLDDAPLMSFSKIARKDDEYRVTSVVIFSSENGGTLPPDLAEEYMRTVDVEWVMQQRFDSDGNLLGTPLYQTANHRPEKFAGKTIFANQPVVDTATANNTFDDGRITIPYIHYSFDNPFDNLEDDALYYSPKPYFFPLKVGDGELVEFYPEMQKWSLIELGFENCLNDQDPELQKILEDVKRVQSNIKSMFPDRGCPTPLSESNYKKLFSY